MSLPDAYVMLIEISCICYFAETWASQGTIRLRVAFSRDQTEKVYVQDLLYKDKQYLWKLISKVIFIEFKYINY